MTHRKLLTRRRCNWCRSEVADLKALPALVTVSWRTSDDECRQSYDRVCQRCLYKLIAFIGDQELACKR